MFIRRLASHALALCFVVMLTAGLAASSRAAAATRDAAAVAQADALLDWAETSLYGPLYFWPHATSQSIGPFRFRYYGRHGIYLGVVVEPDPLVRLGGVYVMGGDFGNQPLHVGQQGDFFTPPPEPPATGAVRFTPGILSANLNEGDSLTLDLTATPQVAFSGTVYVVVEDPAQVLASVDSVIATSQGEAYTRVRLRDDLPRGLHQGRLQVHFCRTANCSSEFAGSPVALPYRFGVVRQDPVMSFFNSGAALSASLPAGASGQFQLTATVNRWPALPLHYRVLDPLGRISGAGEWTSAGGGHTRTLTLTVQLPDAPGRYDGDFELQGCLDRACTERLASERFSYIAFRTVSGLVDAALGATPRLPPLQALPGAADWSTWQGGATHSGYVPGHFDPAGFSLRWRWALPAGKTYGLAPPSVAQGRIALAAQSVGGSADTELFVLDEADGSLRWRLAGDFAAQASFSTPALSATRLFTAVIGLDSNTGSAATTLMAFDLQTGQRQFSTAVPTQFHDSLPPVLAGNRVLLASGYGNGLASIDAGSGSLQWQAASTGFTWWTPAFDGRTVFSYGSGALTAHNPTDGQVRFSVTDAEMSNGVGGGPLTKAFAVDGGRAFVVDHGDLAAFDTRTGQVLWRQATRDHVGTTAAQGGIVVALQQGPLRVEARSAGDGRLLWRYEPLFDVNQGPDQGFVSEPLLSDNLVFISTERGVYALSRSDGQPRWYFGQPGALALSANGVLTIANRNGPELGGGVTAINLR